MVSVCCVTYNHANYIRDALDGILRQKTDFPFEIIVHDDASTDGTADIVREYAAAYPELFVLILQSENQFSKGHKPSVANFERAAAPYIAMCEGDDFWLDDSKLALQKAALEEFHDVDCCSHSVMVLRGSEELEKDAFEDTKRKTSNKVVRVPLEGAISNQGRPVRTVSLMIRRKAAESFLRFSKKHPELPYGDKYLIFLSHIRGGGIQIDRPMACYRLQAAGSWSERMQNSEDFLLRNASAKIIGFRALDRFLDGRFHSVIEKNNFDSLRWVLANRRLGVFTRIRFLKMHSESQHPVSMMRLFLVLVRSLF